MDDEPEPFIVAEVSKNWPETDGVWPRDEPDYRNAQGWRRLLAQRFEDVINTNLERGYHLRDWHLSRLMDGGDLNETIIAVFERG